jgi:hypothetical protein
MFNREAQFNMETLGRRKLEYERPRRLRDFAPASRLIDWGDINQI